MARFNIWASNLGALARGHASADYRLRDGDEVRNLILQLLKAICRNLTFTLSHEAAEDGPRDMHDGGPSSSDEDHSPTLSTASFTFSSESSSDDRYVSSLPAPIVEARREVEDAISRLNRLSTSIRKSGVHYRDLKAISFVDMDEDGSNLTEYYAGLSLLVMNHKFPSAEDNFRKYVADSLARRRNQHAYRRRHQRKLAVRYANENPTPSDFHTKPRPVSSETASNLERSARDTQPQEMRPVLSNTSASLFDPKTFNTSPRSTTSKAPSTVILGTPSQVATLNFPPEPKLAGQDYFQCRYCFLPCPAKEARGKAWKNHVMRDMAPYICIFQDQDCSKTNCFFQTLSEWLVHIRSEHVALQWECVAPAHDTLLFNDVEKYTDHMKQEHQDMFAASQLRTLAQKTARPAAEPFEICPFCNALPDNLVEDGPNSGHDGAQNDLKTHIALHLQSLALLSLSWLDDDQSEGSSQRDSDLALASQTEEVELQDPLDPLVRDWSWSSDPTGELSLFDTAHISHPDDDYSIAAEAHSLGGVMEWSSFLVRQDLEPPPNLLEGLSPELIAEITEKIKKEFREHFEATGNIIPTDNIGKLYEPEPEQGSSEHEPSKQEPSLRQEDTKTVDPISRRWGILFDPEGKPTQRLGQFLRGIANNLIVESFPRNSLVVTTDKMAAFYATYALDKEPHPFLWRTRRYLDYTKILAVSIICDKRPQPVHQRYLL
ncbi:hypothetical protein IFR05_005654 [Cadophora sp. M221]|nr:hypothetical protein IFR05_005654 [Cadophora sp. M221]